MKTARPLPGWLFWSDDSLLAEAVWQRRRGNLLPSYQGAGNSPLPRSRFPRRCVCASACSQCIHGPGRGPLAAEKRSRKRSELRTVRNPAPRARKRTQYRDCCAVRAERLSVMEHATLTSRSDVAAEYSM